MRILFKLLATVCAIMAGVMTSTYLVKDHVNASTLPDGSKFRGQGSLVRISEIPDWRKINDLNKEEQAFLGRVVLSLPKVAAPVVDALAANTIIDKDTSKCPKTYHQRSWVTATKSKIFIHLDSSILRDSPENGYLILHEFGHALTKLGINGPKQLKLLSLQEGFVDAWPGMETMVGSENDQAILTLEEMWAEQWAMWACECNSQSEYGAKRFGDTTFKWAKPVNASLKAKRS